MRRPRAFRAAQLLALMTVMAAGAAAAAAGGAPAPLGWQRGANASAAPPGLRIKNASAPAAAAQIRRLQAGGDADRLLAFKESGNGAGLESWAAGSEPCGAGWNSWNAFRCDINENLIREVARALVDSGLRDAGYKYVNIDDC